MGWYSDIAKDINNIPKAIQYFEDELTEAKRQVGIKGNVEKAAAEMPGIVEQRFNQLQELEAILEYLNIELRRLRSSFFKKYLENYARALSSRDVEKYVDGEADVVDYEKIINEFALMRNKWLGVTKALDQKQWQLTNIVKLRVAGMEDASLQFQINITRRNTLMKMSETQPGMVAKQYGGNTRPVINHMERTD